MTQPRSGRPSGRRPVVLLAALALLLGWSAPARACLSCGCGGSGASADLGALSGASTLFSMGGHWLIQQGVALRGVTGSLNELGGWSPVPTGGALGSLTGTLGVTYFPTMGTSLGLQVPMVGNMLDQASWGPFGSIAATDIGRQTGLALGDLSLQGSWTVYQADTWALAAWGNASLPTGNAGNATGALPPPGTVDTTAVGLSGAGVFSLQGGAMAIAQTGPFELVGNLGFQHPLSAPPASASSLYVGQALLAQAQANWNLSDALRAGLGLNGFLGQGVFGASAVPVPMSKLKVIPSLQWAYAPRQGIRFALGADVPTFGASALTDVTGYVVCYQFFR